MPTPERTAAAAPRPSRAAFALSRLRASPVLRVCALLAFVEYGALAAVAVFGGSLRGGAWPPGSYFPFAGWLAICSLGSWFFLFAWYPFLQSLRARETGDGSAIAMGRVLETLAVTCVAAVHLMLAWILAQAV